METVRTTLRIRRTRAMTQREKIITKIDKLAKAALQLKISGTALHRLSQADRR